MYIGRLGSGENERDGLYTLLKIVFNPLIRQFRYGVADEISIDIGNDGEVRITYPYTDVENIEIVQALSSSYEIDDDGKTVTLYFIPDKAIFGSYEYRDHIVFHLLRSYCHANAGLHIRYNGRLLTANNGLSDLLRERMSFENEYCYPVIHLKGKDIEVALVHKKSDVEYYHSFVNGVKTEGGTHLTALKRAFAKVMAAMYSDLAFNEEDILKGVSAAISIDITEPVYEQAKYGILTSAKVHPEGSELKDFVYDFLSSALMEFFNAKQDVVLQISDRISKSRDYRLQVLKYVSLSPETLTDVWNSTIDSGSTEQLYQIRDAFLAKKIKTSEMQRARAISERLRIYYDKSNNIIRCSGRHFFEQSDKLFQL